VSKCASCHDFGVGTSGLKCLECHAEIRRRVEAHQGFHAHEYKKSTTQTDCRRCHMEHNGQKFDLTRLDRKTFDHSVQAGFVLQGKHHELKCEKCHTAKNIPAAARVEIKMKDMNRSFLGLGRECLSCHEDQHQGQLGRDCLKCHGQDAWKPAPGFSHDRTNYALTGLHEKVVCQKCHGPKPGEKKVQYKGLVSNGCQSCHNDPHRGAFQDTKFRGSCDTCHNTNGWKNNRPSKGFNHDTTKFALKGKHAETACSKCHKTADFHVQIAHERCKDCHEDTHKGQFASRAAGSDCSSCHNEKAYKPATFDRETHRKSKFPLEGRHIPLACVKCHEPEGKDAVYITRKLICSACHADKHDKEFEAAPWKNECDRCHTQDREGFLPSTFSVEQHAKTKYLLTGKHTSVKCGGCHKPLSPGAAKDVPRTFHFATETCITCHTDPHQTTKVTCETCHTPAEWKELRTFDHSTTKFRLEGGHEKPKCIECHPHSEPPASAVTAAASAVPAFEVAATAGGGAGAKTAPVFANTPMQCFNCHDKKDPHGGQFSSGGRNEDCSACHVTARWKPLDFNHDKAQFPLDDAHRNVACVKCHKEQKQAGGKAMNMYRGTPSECVKCH